MLNELTVSKLSSVAINVKFPILMRFMGPETDDGTYKKVLTTNSPGISIGKKIEEDWSKINDCPD
jgi:hypothetical protein